MMNIIFKKKPNGMDCNFNPERFEIFLSFVRLF